MHLIGIRMKLEDFISEALIEIVSGIKRAQTSTESTGAKINPKGYIVPQGKLVGQKWNSKNGDTTEVIEFDIAVTTTEGTETKGGIGVFVGAFGLGSQGRSEAQNSSVTKIKFSVPIVFPSVE